MMIAVLAILALLVFWDVAWRLAGIGQISPHGLKRLLHGPERALYLADARTPFEYRLFRIPGAVNHPRLAIDPDDLPDLGPDIPVVVICLTGHRSPVAAWLLKRSGRRQVSYLVWGMAGWLLAGGTVAWRGGAPPPFNAKAGEEHDGPSSTRNTG